MLFKDKKSSFVLFGLINLLITNLILQVCLFLIPTIIATLISQLFNFLFGFYLYGRKVFKVKVLTKNQLLKYFLLSTLIWNLNWISISYLSLYGYAKNIIALSIVPPLALISYIFQKNFVFKK